MAPSRYRVGLQALADTDRGKTDSRLHRNLSPGRKVGSTDRARQPKYIRFLKTDRGQCLRVPRQTVLGMKETGI